MCDLKLLSINVCGLKSKLVCPEFIDYLNTFDIIACEETKLDNFDDIHLDQHQCVFKHRKQKVLRKSGGIAVLVRNEIFKFFSSIDSDCEYVQWFKMSKCLFNTTEDVMFGAVYIPPAKSDYRVDEILELFNSELDEHARTYKNLILMGDFNARTSNLIDLTETDTDIYDSIDVDPEDVFNTDNIYELNKYDFAIKRTSQDKITNRCVRI